ncbi:hypothetical protein TIFTF001_021958 [Ficus carica]|uniref:Uncharacterized protein n=1 Tax=Ficus carica TaxID=3494 RepID=A0AA88DF29_FICCA|nr:hypothetical protein TIFTF001_021958 [Ficus carica]
MLTEPLAQESKNAKSQFIKINHILGRERDLLEEIALRETIEAEDEAVSAGEDGGGSSGVPGEIGGGGDGEAGEAPAKIRRAVEDAEANDVVRQRRRGKERKWRRGRGRGRGRAAQDREGGGGEGGGEG